MANKPRGHRPDNRTLVVHMRALFGLQRSLWCIALEIALFRRIEFTADCTIALTLRWERIDMRG